MMAGTSVGYISRLDIYNTQLYTLWAKKDYGKTIGELMTDAVAEVYKNIGEESDYMQRAQCEEYTLNGDPAVRLYQFDKPDYAIEDASVNIAPNFISIAETNFTVKARINNLGKAINKAVIVELKRTLPDGSSSVFKRDTLSPVRFSDSLLYSIPIDPVKDKGQNKIMISIDPENTIPELNEGNNSIIKDVYIYEDEIRPVYPYDNAIVSQPIVTLAASTANPLAASRVYMMEMDTTLRFNSPARISKTQTSSGGLLEFDPGISLANNTVYYWRVASKPAGSEMPHWNGYSFTYIQGSETGFSQSNYYQLKANTFNDIELDSVTRQFKFAQSVNDLYVRGGIYPVSSGNGSYYGGAINQVEYFISAGCNYDELIINVINDSSGKVMLNGQGLYGSSLPCGPTREYNFMYSLATPQSRNLARDFLKMIPDGSYVVVRPNPNLSDAMNTYSSVWKSDNNGSNNLYTVLKEQGFDQIDNFNKVSTFIFIYRKNKKSDFPPLTAFSSESPYTINIGTKFNTIHSSGSMETPPLGSSSQWKRLFWNGAPSNDAQPGKASFDLIGIDRTGNEIILQKEIPQTGSGMDISNVNPVNYPYLKIRMNTIDSTGFAPFQLKDWRLSATLLPEGAIAPNLYFLAKDTLDVGEPLNFGIAFKNASAFKFDSMKVKLTIRNRNNAETVLKIPDQKALIAGDTIKLSIPISSKQFEGTNSLFVEFNPSDILPEQYHFNNFLYKEFFVKSDTTGPYVDVTFDGLHILNKDIVSAKPDILVKLTDEAKWLLLDNPDLIKVQLVDKTRDITFNYKAGTDTLQFTPAGQGGENTATMNFRPHMDDGDYELVISAKDQSGNNSGQIQYRVGFQVINKPMISNMLNYPNPFTTATAFVFTLTGSEVPQNIRIQILTITGKIVREITKAELGQLRIGRNITEYRWDGTDQYGQKLANGVYLYRVITNLNGKALDKYKAKDDNTDKYFNKGYGKMYLMR